MEHKKQKEMIVKMKNQLSLFNSWELRVAEKPDIFICLAAVFELYDMIPDRQKQRPINIEGIKNMHKDLACLG